VTVILREVLNHSSLNRGLVYAFRLPVPTR
jgi:hypothetical protein